MKVFWRNKVFEYYTPMKDTSLLHIVFYAWTYKGCLRELQAQIPGNKTKLVATPNPEMLYEASHDMELLDVLRNADYKLPDGAWIFVAYQMAQDIPVILKLLLTPYWCIRAMVHNESFTENYGERITGSRLTRDLLDFANTTQTPVTIIDTVVSWTTSGDEAKRASQKTTQQILQEKYPNIPFSIIISDTPPENLPKNGIVFATHGNGRQEKLLARTQKINPESWIMLGVWGSIDLITWFRSPAPLFFRRFGGEWLYRLINNPRRHCKRMKKVLHFLASCY